MGESSKNSKIRYFCNLCNKDYAYPSGLRRHMRNVHENVAVDGFKCQKCEKTFQSARSLGAHNSSCLRKDLSSMFFKCTKCSKHYSKNYVRDRHEIQCSNDTTCGVSTSREREAVASTSRGSGFNVQFGGGRRRSTRTNWSIEKVRQCLNVAVTYRATPNFEATTIGAVHHAMQSLKTIITDRFNMFHAVKVHFNVEGMYRLYIYKCMMG